VGSGGDVYVLTDAPNGKLLRISLMPAKADANPQPD